MRQSPAIAALIVDYAAADAIVMLDVLHFNEYAVSAGTPFANVLLIAEAP